MKYKIQYGGIEAKENCKTRVGFILKRQLIGFIIGFIVKMKLKGVILTSTGWRKKNENEQNPATSELKCSPDRV